MADPETWLLRNQRAAAAAASLPPSAQLPLLPLQENKGRNLNLFAISSPPDKRPAASKQY